MREILFRGKRIDNGEWVEGFYCRRKEKIFGGIKTRHMIVISDADSYSGARWIDVDSSTVGQCVPGLTDKNGKKIYEGDILERTNVNGEKYKEYVVAGQWSYKWTHGVYGFSLTDLNGGYMMDLHNTKSYEIIGNIHDNPEILKGE